MLNKNYYIKDFIGVFENYMPHDICDALTVLFEREKKLQRSWNRKSEGTPRSLKNDESISLSRDNVGEVYELLNMFLKNLREALDIYLEDTDILKYSGTNELHVQLVKIQKTYPSGGYHMWHVEKDYGTICSRFLVYTVYLNDIENGGETEFLFQKTRIAPKKGTVCFFPAQFPYVHRGNPPLDKEKYIATSWLNIGHTRPAYD